MKEIMKKLTDVFKEKELQFRAGATTQDKTKGLAIAYVKTRGIQNRLDNWIVEYREIKDGFICRLEIKVNNEWIYKKDEASIKEVESVKGDISSSFN